MVMTMVVMVVVVVVVVLMTGSGSGCSCCCFSSRVVVVVVVIVFVMVHGRGCVLMGLMHAAVAIPAAPAAAAVHEVMVHTSRFRLSQVSVGIWMLFDTISSELTAQLGSDV